MAFGRHFSEIPREKVEMDNVRLTVSPKVYAEPAMVPPVYPSFLKLSSADLAVLPGSAIEPILTSDSTLATPTLPLTRGSIGTLAQKNKAATTN